MGEGTISGGGTTTIPGASSTPIEVQGESSGVDINTVIDGLREAFTSVANSAMDAIAAVLPVVLPVMGAVVVIVLAVGIFKRFVH